MKTFKINEKFEIICRSENTRYGFRHLAELHENGYLHTKAKICYYNRTWESFEYESVISDLLNKAKIMTSEEKKTYLDLLRKNNLEEINRQFSFLGTIAKIGEIMTENKTEANDWKKRMLQAGLPGLDIPEDWNELTEDEKEKRLNNVIDELKKK